MTLPSRRSHWLQLARTGLILSAPLASTLACRTLAGGDDHGKPSELASLDHAPGADLRLRDWKASVMEASRQPLADTANALGFGWAGGCNGGVGDDMHVEWGAQDATSSYVSTYDGTGGCGASNQAPDRRLSVIYHWDKPGFRNLNIDMTKRKTTRMALKSLYTLVTGWAPVESKVSFNVSRTISNSVTARQTNILRESGELDLEFDATVFGMGMKTTGKLVIGGEQQTGQDVVASETDTFGLSRDIVLPAKQCIIITFERLEEEYTVPYTADVALTGTAELSGFLRAKDNGGNFHREHRNDSSRPSIRYTFGVPGAVPFWEAVNTEKASNSFPWMWNDAMANRDGFDHGAVINSSLASLKANFVAGHKNVFKVRGLFDVIKGGQVKSTVRMLPNTDPSCAKAGNRPSDVIQ